MKSAILILTILALFGRAALSQICSDPVRDCLKNNTNLKTGELLSGEAWTGLSGSQPPGGYLLRFEAPIGPNGASVLFVCLSVLSNQKSSTWYAYTHIDNDRYLLASDGIEFGSIPTFYLLPPNDKGHRGLAEIYAGKETFSVTTYRLDSSGHLEVDNLPGIPRDQDAEYSNPKVEDKEIKDLLQKDRLKKQFIPRIKKVLLAEYLQNLSLRWRPFNRSFGVTSQQADPEEKGVVDAEKDFTQKRASELWKALRN